MHANAGLGSKDGQYSHPHPPRLASECAGVERARDITRGDEDKSMEFSLPACHSPSTFPGRNPMTTFKLYDHTGEQLLGSCTKVEYRPPEAATLNTGKAGETTIEERLFIKPRLVLKVESVPASNDLRLENSKGERQDVKVVARDEVAKTIAVEGILSPEFVDEGE